MNNNRITKLQQSIKHSVLVKKKENLLYLTGRSFMQGYLLVKKNDLVFFGDGLEKTEGMPKVDRLKNVGKYLRSGSTLEIEDAFTFAESKYIRLKNKDLRLKIRPATSPVDQIRIVKEASEINLIGKSMKIVEQVFFQVKKQLKRKSWSERDLSKFIKKTGMLLGAENVSFDPIVASGANAAIPHHVPSSKILKKGESIIVDMGFKYHGYCSDFTRTVFLKTVSGKIKIAYEQTELAYLRGLWESHVGAMTSYIYRTAVKVFAEKKLDKYFIHNLGHGTGLEIHELPNLSPQSKESLENGMVFSIEPGVYIPKTGGIRIEDLVYLDAGKLRKFIHVSTKLSDNII